MTVRIEITAETGADARLQMLDLIAPQRMTASGGLPAKEEIVAQLKATAATETPDPAPAATETPDPAPTEVITPPAETSAAPVGRLYGNAPEGKKRRTKAEIAVDEAIDAELIRTGQTLTAEIAEKAGADEILANLKTLPDKAGETPAADPVVKTPVAPEASAEPGVDPRDALRAIVGEIVKTMGVEKAKAEVPKALGVNLIGDLPDDADFPALEAKLHALLA